MKSVNLSRIFLLLSLLCAISPVKGNDKTLKLIEVGFNKTTHVYFNSTIKYVDVGDTENILWQNQGELVKLTATNNAASGETNLTIHTEKGLYGFLIRFVQNPSYPYYFIDPELALKKIEITVPKKSDETIKKVDQSSNKTDSPSEESIIYEEGNLDGTNQKNESNTKVKDSFVEISKQVMEEESTVFNAGLIHNNIMIALGNILTYDDLIIMKFDFENKSPVDYDLSYINFSLKDNRKFRKQITQEFPVVPVHIDQENKNVVKAETKIFSKVFIFKKFIPTKHRRFYAEFAEENGRTIRFEILPMVFRDAKLYEEVVYGEKKKRKG